MCLSEMVKYYRQLELVILDISMQVHEYLDLQSLIILIRLNKDHNPIKVKEALFQNTLINF